jgi:hypothetical protein
MRVFTTWELMRWTREQLKMTSDQISRELLILPEGSLDRRIALINLSNIQRELTRRDMTAGRWSR